MLHVATNFYKNLFSYEPRLGFSLSPNFFSSKELITDEQNAHLQTPFNEEEIRAALFSSYPDGAPGPDGFPFLFLQKFWSLIKFDIISMFSDFYEGNLDIFRLNFAVLTLIPKEPNAIVMKKFRPISLLNCIFKLFTKVLTNRLAGIMNLLVACNQSAFIKG